MHRLPTGPIRSLSLFVALLALLVVATPRVFAQSVIRFLEADEQLVERQLAAEVQAYLRARIVEDGALGDLAEAAQSLDRALQDPALGDNTPFDRLLDLTGAVRQARARLDAARHEVEAMTEAIVATRRRLAIVREELRRRRSAPADLPDPITGAWNLSMEDTGPQQDAVRTGLLDLELDGTAVTGTLGLVDGTFGSVRGTFVRGALELERVSADSGLDLILEGRYDPASGTLAGNWRLAVAGLGNPGGGTWTAVRAEPPPAQ